MLCDFAEYNKFRRLICTAESKKDSPLCPY